MFLSVRLSTLVITVAITVAQRYLPLRAAFFYSWRNMTLRDVYVSHLKVQRKMRIEMYSRDLLVNESTGLRRSVQRGWSRKMRNKHENGCQRERERERTREQDRENEN